MTNEVSTTNQNTPTLAGSANAFAAAGSELGGSTLPILKLSKAGTWVFGAENTPVTETRFAADVQGVQRGHVCFVDGDVVEEALVPVVQGKAISPDDLADHGPYEEGDGWAESASLQLRSIETGEEFVFKPTSHGGRSAIGALLTKFGYRLNVGKAGVPIIDLAVTSYDHKRYGTVFKPVFKIVTWQDETELVDGVDVASEGALEDSIPF